MNFIVYAALLLTLVYLGQAYPGPYSAKYFEEPAISNPLPLYEELSKDLVQIEKRLRADERDDEANYVNGIVKELAHEGYKRTMNQVIEFIEENKEYLVPKLHSTERIGEQKYDYLFAWIDESALDLIDIESFALAQTAFGAEIYRVLFIRRELVPLTKTSVGLFLKYKELVQYA